MEPTGPRMQRRSRRPMDLLVRTQTGSTTNITTRTLFELVCYVIMLISFQYNRPQERAMKRSLRKGGANTLNVYSVGFTSHPGLLGYATFPWSYLSDRTNDGVVLYFKTLPGGGLTAYSLGRTLTHEAGHWLGLFHTFENGCSAPGDGVADTPAEATPAYGCPVRRDTCPGAGQDPFRKRSCQSLLLL